MPKSVSNGVRSHLLYCYSNHRAATAKHLASSFYYRMLSHPLACFTHAAYEPSKGKVIRHHHTLSPTVTARQTGIRNAPVHTAPALHSPSRCYLHAVSLYAHRAFLDRKAFFKGQYNATMLSVTRWLLCCSQRSRGAGDLP